jgi:hypothetical protein
MGWAYCGEDSQGRPIGYAIAAVCDEPGCTAAIDRGISYACGGMHGADEWWCEKYFCEQHRRYIRPIDNEIDLWVCRECLAAIEKAIAADQPDTGDN